MNIRKFLFPSLLVGVGFGLLRRAFAKPAGTKPVSKTSASDSRTDEIAEAIDTYLDQQIHRLNIPGASLAIVENDQIVHLRGFGRARPGGETPSTQTPFFIGSITKSFTALAAMQLVEEEKIELDAPVQHYLPWFRVADPQTSIQITVRHLLNQTSSLPLVESWQLLTDFDDRPDATERQARALATLSLTRPVGSGFEYSNFNYNLLGLIIEAVSGESYADYIQKHIYDPLKMHHSYTSKATAKQDGLAVGHQYWFGIPIAVPDFPIPNGSLPSGQLISSAEDMGRYLIAHLNGGRCGEAQILSPWGIAELHRPAVDASAFGVTEHYGMGWYIQKQDQSKVIWHSGMNPDFYAYLALLPEQKKGVALLINANHFTGQLTLTEVGEGVTTLLAGHPPAPIRFGIVPWIQRALLLIPLFQIASVITTLGTLRRWHRDPALRPSRQRIWGQHILLSLFPNLTLAAILIYLRSTGLLGFMHLFSPDFSWFIRISGGFAGIWGFLRTGMILRSLGKVLLPRHLR